MSVSEQIGGFKSKADYEKQRKALKAQRDLFLKNATDAQAHFGDQVFEMFPQLLISKAVQDAKQKIHLKIEKNRLPSGISKKFNFADFVVKLNNLLLGLLSRHNQIFDVRTLLLGFV